MRFKINGKPEIGHDDMVFALWDMFRRLPEGAEAISFNCYINFRDKSGRAFEFTFEGERVDCIEYVHGGSTSHFPLLLTAIDQNYLR